jgi:hypothetical protein
MQWMWPAGAAALVVLGLEAWSPFGGKGADLVQYLAQGTIVPLLLLCYVLLERRWGSPRLWVVRFGLGSVAVVAAAALVIQHASLAAGALTCAQLLITGLVLRSPLLRRESLRHTAGLALVLVAAWTATLTLVWWGPPAVNPVALLDLSSSARVSPWSALAVAGAVVVVLWLCVAKFHGCYAPRRRWPGWLPVAAAAAIFGYAGLQTLGLQDVSSAMTWGFYVGPAELIRQGGWPLWDVPSQYGILSVLLIAWLPLHSAWESLFVLNACANAALALLVYWVLRRRGGGIVDWTASVLIAVAVVFLRAGSFPYFAGPPMFPSTGGYRFVFCVALLAVLLRVAREPSGRVPMRWLMAGTALWLVSLAWSAEAGLYATATWIPAYVLLVWPIANGRPWLRVRLIAAPFAAAACAVGVVAAVYMVGLGHLPDLRAYLEYATAYAGGFGSLIANPAGPALALLFGLAILGGLWVWSARRDGLARPTTAFLTGAFLAAWTTSSYFATRSHPNNAVNLAPIFVVCLAGALQLTARGGTARIHTELRALLIPLVGALMIGTFGYVDGVAGYVQHPPAAVTSVQSLFWNNPDLTAFMAATGIPRGAPIAVADDPINSVLPPQDGDEATYWLPVAPYAELTILPMANRLAHLQRYVQRHRMSGWLIVQRVRSPNTGWLSQALLQWYEPMQSVSQGDWIATYFRYREATP